MACVDDARDEGRCWLTSCDYGGGQFTHGRVTRRSARDRLAADSALGTSGAFGERGWFREPDAASASPTRLARIFDKDFLFEVDLFRRLSSSFVSVVARHSHLALQSRLKDAIGSRLLGVEQSRAWMFPSLFPKDIELF